MPGRAAERLAITRSDPGARPRPLPRGQSESKAQLVYATVRHEIISGELRPEASIDKLALCERFQVSRLTVTSAIERLAHEGLVVIAPQSGSYVSRISLRDVKQWMLIRRLLECDMAAQAAERLDEKWLELLARNIAYQRTAVSNADVDGFHQLDIAFHGILIEGLGLHRVGEVLDKARTHIDRTRRMLLPQPGRQLSTFKEHQAICRALAEKDKGRASAAMATHLDRVMSELEAFELRHPDFFS